MCHFSVTKIRRNLPKVRQTPIDFLCIFCTFTELMMTVFGNTFYFCRGEFAVGSAAHPGVPRQSSGPPPVQGRVWLAQHGMLRGIILQEANPMSGGVFQNIDPPPPSRPTSVYPPCLWCRGRTHSLGGAGEGVGGGCQYFGRRQTLLCIYSTYVSTLWWFGWTPTYTLWLSIFMSYYVSGKPCIRFDILFQCKKYFGEKKPVPWMY